VVILLQVAVVFETPINYNLFTTGKNITTTLKDRLGILLSKTKIIMERKSFATAMFTTIIFLAFNGHGQTVENITSVLKDGVAAFPNLANENDDVTISFSIPESAAGNTVSFKAVDMVGRNVWMNEAVFAGGYQEVKWKRNEGEAKGMYIISVRSGNEVKQIRVVVK
jgi:hypothetical protein